jgi:hypothetical protein
LLQTFAGAVKEYFPKEYFPKEYFRKEYFSVADPFVETLSAGDYNP